MPKNKRKLGWKAILGTVILSGLTSSTMFASGLNGYSWRETEELLHNGRIAKPHLQSLTAYTALLSL